MEYQHCYTKKSGGGHFVYISDMPTHVLFSASRYDSKFCNCGGLTHTHAHTNLEISLFHMQQAKIKYVKVGMCF